MGSIVVVACGKGVESAGEPVDGRLKGRVLFVGKDNVEIAIELLGSKVAKVSRDQRQADEFGLGALLEHC